MHMRSRLPLRLLLACAFASCLVALGCASSTGGSGYISRTSTVTAYRLNVRADPSINAPVLEVISRGQTVDVLSRRYNWIKIRTPNHHVGWSYGAFLSGFNIPKPETKAPEYKEAQPEKKESEEPKSEQPPVVL
ncbi:SH3 domain-containing protein [Oceanidesulfovibrio marinus]|uniref:SH3b domain-containing protein n=1 Tax=Oceanidesulfovibrio marinus TaxID=370038 RepID=A0A6P1ZD37_9BACT|nr:SH3 domain-containing protein [Oceanidesulfovibrio marinus]TVM30665.1 hypothetical protein DQK91_20075 [Oceanidesulfovibrio marinus]